MSEFYFDLQIFSYLHQNTSYLCWEGRVSGNKLPGTATCYKNYPSLGAVQHNQQAFLKDQHREHGSYSVSKKDLSMYYANMP